MLNHHIVNPPQFKPPHEFTLWTEHSHMSSLHSKSCWLQWLEPSLTKKIMFAYYISRVEHSLLTLVAYKTTLTCIGWIAHENILSLAKDGATGN
jgi:hypothetical protein